MQDIFKRRRITALSVLKSIENIKNIILNNFTKFIIFIILPQYYFLLLIFNEINNIRALNYVCKNKYKKTPTRVLHLPTSVGGNSYGLSRAERKLGLESDVLTIDSSYLGYPSDVSFHLTGDRYKNMFKIFSFIYKINKKYNVFHFNFGSSLYTDSNKFLNFIDLNLYNKGSKLIVTYNGCDCRQKDKIIKKYDICACSDDECYNGACNSKKINIKKKRRIKKMVKFCDTVFYLNPDLKQFLPESSVFLPYSIATWDMISNSDRVYNYPLKIVHAPSQRGAKGTKHILSIIEEIKRNFPDKIKFILVEGMKNSEAIKIYEQADILIDQIFVGWYGALSVEAMKAGCAVMVYIREEDLQYVPSNMHEDIKRTFINCNKNNLYEKIAEIIEYPDNLIKYSKYSFEYVNTWHNPEYVASITKKYYGF